jgi:hypothetical protein
LSLEIVTLTEELRKIDDADTTLRDSAKKLRTFILSPKFLDDYIQFEQFLSDFQDKVITLVELTTSPQAFIQQLQAALGQPKEQKQLETAKPSLTAPFIAESFTLEKALIVIASIVGCGIAVEQRLLPPIAILFVIVGGLSLAFAPQLKSILETLLKKEEKKEEEIAPENLEDWINESIAKIRSEYMSARFLIKVQTQTKETLPPQYRDLGLDEALFNREQYFHETLPHEFLSRIGRIMVACDRSMWTRKQLIVTAMVQAAQTVPARA